MHTYVPLPLQYDNPLMLSILKKVSDIFESVVITTEKASHGRISSECQSFAVEFVFSELKQRYMENKNSYMRVLQKNMLNLTNALDAE